MRKVAFVAAAMATFALGGAAQAATNLVVNGGFEADAVSGSFTPSLQGTALTGWTIDVGSIDLLSSSNSGGHYPASSGTQSIDLAGSLGTFGNSLFQDFATVAGKKYDFSFVVLGSTDNINQQNPYNFTATNTFTGLNPANLLKQTNFSHLNTDPNWTTISGSFIAESELTRIRFTDTSTGMVNQGVYLDDVSVTAAVPEVGTWAMMLIGFGGIGGALRSRRASKPVAALA